MTDPAAVTRLADEYVGALLQRQVNRGVDDERVLAAENAILDELDVSLDETEQGLTPNARALVDDFVRLHSSQVATPEYLPGNPTSTGIVGWKTVPVDPIVGWKTVPIDPKEAT